MKFYDDEKLPIKKAAVEAFRKAIEKNEMYEVGVGNMAYTEEVSQAKTILKEMQQKLIFGMDLFNGYCSGNVKIKIKDDGQLSIWADDIKYEYIFKFKSLLLFVPEYKTDESPILILESADDKVEVENVKYVYKHMLVGRFINDHIEYDQNQLQEFYNRCEYDETFVEPDELFNARALKFLIYFVIPIIHN